MTGVTQAEFAGLLASRGARRTIRAGSVIFREGDAGMFVYGVVRGRVRITTTASTGREVVLDELGPGTWFGEFAVLEGRPRSATATATQDTELAELDLAYFLELLNEAPSIAVSVLRRLSRSLQEISRRLGDSVGADVSTRVAQRLLDLVAAAPDSQSMSGDIELNITQDELASWLGTTRESVARALKPFRDERCIATGRGHIVVLDTEALRRFCV